jgi:3-deoxy-D-manno-octulosonate 8-phosphate phosphatase (KDO 8-P phosphatase)
MQKSPMTTESLKQRCERIEMLVLDVDGVLTDGRIYYSDRGDELKAFHVRDGSGLKFWMQLGKRVGIITGRSSPVVTRRAAELGVTMVIQGAEDKGVAYDRLLQEQGLDAAAVCAIGDDLPDLPLLRRSGLAVAVADACADAKAAAHYVTATPGGRGAVREVVELMLQAQGRWSAVTACFAG